MNTKALLASTLLTALFVTTSASAEGRAGGLLIEANNSPTQSLSIQKVSLQSAQAHGMAGDLSVEVNGYATQQTAAVDKGVNR